MLINFTHPVIASARTLRSEEVKRVIGTAETEVEVAEFDPSEVEPAFEIPGKQPIVSMGDRLWCKSSVNLNLLSKSLSQLSKISENEIALIDNAFHKELGGLWSTNRALLVPRPPSGFDAAYGESMEFLDAAGPISAREKRLAFLDESDVDIWRSRMRSFIDSYAVVDGVTYERCHEPLMVVVAGRIVLSESSIYRRFINQTALTPEGWIDFPDHGLLSYSHAFPADAEDEVVRFSEQVNGGEADVTWFLIDCHGKCSSVNTILELETCRFAMMHARYFSVVERKFRTRFGAAATEAELNSGGSDFASYARAARRAAEAATRHLTETPCHDEVSDAFDDLVAVASRADKFFETDGDRNVWNSLSVNTEHMRSRMDDLPISLSVTRNHGPKG